MLCHEIFHISISCTCGGSGFLLFDQLAEYGIMKAVRALSRGGAPGQVTSMWPSTLRKSSIYNHWSSHLQWLTPGCVHTLPGVRVGLVRSELVQHTPTASLMTARKILQAEVTRSIPDICLQHAIYKMRQMSSKQYECVLAPAIRPRQDRDSGLKWRLHTA